MRGVRPVLCSILMMALLLCLPRVGWAQGVVCPAIAYLAPQIVDRAVTQGTRVRFDGLSRGQGSQPVWQWYHDGVPMTGVTGDGVTIEAAQPDDAGLYRIRDLADPCFFVPDERLQVIPPKLANDCTVSCRIVTLNSGPVVAWGAADLPADVLWNITAVALDRQSFSPHKLALRYDGTVVSWGFDPAFRPWLVPPAGLRGVLDIKAGSEFSLALRTDGTVVAWGSNALGQATPPAGLDNVIAIAAGDATGLALRADGTVVAWGDPAAGLPPAGLANVVAIAAGRAHALALKADGTVVAWGANDQGQSAVPAGLANVVAIDAAMRHSVALLADGTAVAWGCEPVTSVCDPALRVLGTGVQGIQAMPYRDLMVRDNNVFQTTSTLFPLVPMPVDSAWSGRSLTAVAAGYAVTLATELSYEIQHPLRLTGAGQFDLLATGSASTGQLVRINNISSKMVRISNLRPGDGFQVVGGNCRNGSQLAAWGHCTLQVTFSPTKPGTFDDGLHVDVANADGSAALWDAHPTRYFELRGTSVSNLSRASVALHPGWNLMGNASQALLPVQDLFGTPDRPITGVTEHIVSVWQWSNAGARWQFYSPQFGKGYSAAYASMHQLQLLDAIAPREGYWVQTNAALAFPLPAGLPLAFDSAAFAGLPSGWHQLADAGRRHPRDFNAALSATPPQPGTTPAIPQNFQSLWAWDAAQSRWYFYAPSLDAQGGSAMADYIAGRGLLDFSAAGRVLDPASGFWVLKP